MSKKIIALVFGTLLVVGALQAQPKSQKPEDVYHWRIKQDKLSGVYIPKDLSECFTELNKKITPSSKAKFKKVDEIAAMEKLHFSLGRWIWYNWGFYGGSRLSVYMNKVGVSHPEDMADFIVVSYHRFLNKKPLDAKKLVEYFQERRKKEKEATAKKNAKADAEG